jgi:hypothetical protein
MNAGCLLVDITIGAYAAVRFHYPRGLIADSCFLISALWQKTRKERARTAWNG